MLLRSANANPRALSTSLFLPALTTQPLPSLASSLGFHVNCYCLKADRGDTMNSLMKRLLNAQKSPKIATKMQWGIKECKIILAVSCCCTINHGYLLTKGTALWSDYLSQKRIEKKICRQIQKQTAERKRSFEMPPFGDKLKSLGQFRKKIHNK